jgi:hypothetical protein
MNEAERVSSITGAMAERGTPWRYDRATPAARTIAEAHEIVKRGKAFGTVVLGIS